MPAKSRTILPSSSESEEPPKRIYSSVKKKVSSSEEEEKKQPKRIYKTTKQKPVSSSESSSSEVIAPSKMKKKAYISPVKKKPLYSPSSDEEEVKIHTEYKKKLFSPLPSDSESSLLDTEPIRKKEVSPLEEKEESSEDSSSEEEEVAPYIGKDYFTKLPDVIIKKIMEMLQGEDNFNLMKSSGLLHKIISTMHLDLSGVSLTVPKLNRMIPDLMKFKTLSLRLAKPGNLSVIESKITHLVIDYSFDINNIKRCPLKSLEIRSLFLSYSLEELMVFPDLESLIIKSKPKNNTVNLEKIGFVLPTKLKYLYLENSDDVNVKIIGGLTNLETLIIKKVNNLGNLLDNCLNLKVVELYNINNQTYFGFTAKLTKLERFIFKNKEENIGLVDTLSFGDSIKYVDININAKKCVFEDCAKLRELYIEEYNSEGVLILNGCSGLEELHLNISDITNLDFLSGCPNLNTLTIKGDFVGDFSPLAECPKLRVFQINSGKLMDLSTLPHLPNLKTAKFKVEVIKSIYTLSGLSGLTSLHIDIQAGTGNLNFIGNMLQLERLILSNSHTFINVKPLFSLVNLKYLVISDMTIKNIKRASNWANIEVLHLSNIKDLTSVKYLSDCRKLRSLTLNGCGVVNLDGLNKCKNLTTLHCKKCNPLEDITGITGSNITTFSLIESSVKDVSPLLTLNHLNNLTLQGNNSIKNGKNILNRMKDMDTLLTDFDSLKNLNHYLSSPPDPSDDES